MIETDHTTNVICPYCGYEHRDSWEIDFGAGMEGDTEMECNRCDETFIASRCVTVTYSTCKAGEKKEDNRAG